MWYRVDFIKLAVQLLPPILRSRFLISLLSVMTAPLRQVYGRFCILKDSVDSRLNTTGSVVCLENALNDAFYLTDRQIHIETPDEKDAPVFWFADDIQEPNTMYLLSEDKGFMLENVVSANFIVKVPTFLCTSADSRDDDRHEWRYLATIKNILNTYKPAGRTFSIELYDYE